MSKESVIKDIRELLSENDPKTRLRMIEGIKIVLQRRFPRTSINIPEISCPVCGCIECIRYGRTRAGT